MRSLLLAALNCLIGNKPRAATTTKIASACVRPARDVAFVLIRDPKRKPINFDTARFREVKNVFVAIVQETPGADGLEMSIRSNITISIFDADRLDPVDCVLKNKDIAQRNHDFVWQHRIRRRRTNVEKKRPGRS